MKEEIPNDGSELVEGEDAEPGCSQDMVDEEWGEEDEEPECSQAGPAASAASGMTSGGKRTEASLRTIQIAESLGLKKDGPFKERVQAYCKAMIEQDVSTLKTMHRPALFSPAEMSALWHMMKG